MRYVKRARLTHGKGVLFCRKIRDRADADRIDSCADFLYNKNVIVRMRFVAADEAIET